MKYKLLLLDVDGTTVPIGPHTMPSLKVRESIKQARDTVGVSLVSGRPLNWLRETFESLDLVQPCIINGGSQIIDPKTHEVLWERPLSNESFEGVLRIIDDMDISSFIINDNGTEYKNPKDHQCNKPLAIQLSYFNSKEESDFCLKRLQQVPDISAHKFYSWDKNRNYIQEVYITHLESNKQHAVKKLASILGVDYSEIIAVGDARNDIPLLEICGLKVAMGNADNKLKLIADYIAPTVDDDGVAHVIEKFIIGGEELPSKRKGLISRFFSPQIKK